MTNITIHLDAKNSSPNQADESEKRKYQIAANVAFNSPEISSIQAARKARDSKMDGGRTAPNSSSSNSANTTPRRTHGFSLEVLSTSSVSSLNTTPRQKYLSGSRNVIASGFSSVNTTPHRRNTFGSNIERSPDGSFTKPERNLFPDNQSNRSPLLLSVRGRNFQGTKGEATRSESKKGSPGPKDLDLGPSIFQSQIVKLLPVILEEKTVLQTELKNGLTPISLPGVDEKLSTLVFTTQKEGVLVTAQVDSPIPDYPNCTSEIETKALSWAKEKNLYPGKQHHALVRTCVAWLVGCCYSKSELVQDERKMLALTKWIMMLFAIDDTLDPKNMTYEEVKALNDRKKEVINGGGLQESDPVRTKVMRELLVEYGDIFLGANKPEEPTAGIAINQSAFGHYFVKSFLEYISSVATENQLKSKGLSPNEEFVNNLRGYSSGAVHAIKCGFAVCDIEYETLELEFFDLSTMIKQVALHVGLVNDIASWAKEANGEKLNGNSFSMNLVDIYYRQISQEDSAYCKESDTQRLQRSMNYVAQRCNHLLQEFYKEKSRVLEQINSLPMSEVGQKKKRDAVEAIKIMESWLCQAYWTNVPRYNQQQSEFETGQYDDILRAFAQKAQQLK